MRVSFNEMFNEFVRVLLKNGFTREKAESCAKIFTQNSCDGVYSHGLNRFPSFLRAVQKGYIDVNAQPEKIESFGAMERWDGHYGPGILNASFAMSHAMDIARENGMGCVAIKNTNHWMRGATYGWQAADAGFVAICWTTAIPSMPPWGAIEPKLGNNPIVLAIPRKEGHIVLDMALSQFSYGKLQTYQLNNKMLPIEGGYDKEGHLTCDPTKIQESKLALPIGHWKGAGLSLLLDLIAMILTGGRSVYELGKQEEEHGISQVFIAFDLSKLPDQSLLHQRVNDVIQDFHSAVLTGESGKIRYPGEGTLKTRKENMERGIPVEPSFWKKILEM